MILIFFILNSQANYLDSLLLSNLNRSYIEDSIKNFENFEIKFTYRKKNLTQIELIDLENNSENKIVEALRNKLKEQIEKKTEHRGTGLIPDIVIPVPIELPFGLTDETKVKIGGFQNLSMGVQRDEFRAHSATTPQGSSSPGIKLEQQLKVNAEGIIGGKIHLLLDHDSQRETQDLQTVKIRYEGDEDEIIKYIEGGNQIGTQGSGGLFGIAGKFQLAAFDIEATASREMGNQKELVLTRGGVIVDTFKIEDKDFEKNKFFLIPLERGDEIVIDSIYVFYNDNIESNDTLITNPFKGKTFLFDKPDSLSNRVFTFQLLKRDSAYVNIFFTNVIKLNIHTSQDFILAACYKTKNRGWIGFLNKSNPLDTSNKFILLREYALNNFKDPTWKYMLKNIYYVGQIDSASLKIVRYSSPYNIEQESGRTFLNILGLDKNNDGILDRYVNFGGIINFTPFIDGYLFIPHFEPFAHESLSVKDTIIYRTFSETEILQRDHIYKIITVTRRRPTNINLGITGIVKNSEEVYFGSERWENGKDYIIDYETGTMQILNKEYQTDFSRELKIKFNERAIFQTKKRSFLNLRGNYSISENSNLNFGIDYRGESTADKKITFGEEPKRVFLLNSSFNFERNLPFNLFSFIPWIDDEKESKVKVLTKFSQSFPDPNTRNFAYLDDMESTSLEIFADLSSHSWIYGSLPIFFKDSTNGNVKTPEDYFENNLIWFETNKFLYRDIYPYIPGQQGNKTANVMEIILDPGIKQSRGFASLTQLLSREGIDITSYDYLEVIVRGDRGIIGIDIATEVSEDACFRDIGGNLIGQGIENSEDGANGGWEDGKLQASKEDVGLDMVPDGSPGDAGNDNYEQGNISKINGTEGNGRLDKEDLDSDGFNLDKEDCFTYILDLTYGYYQIHNGFKFYKIPLEKYSKKYGNPEIIRIKKIRIFFTEFPKKDTIYLAKISITGNKYIAQGVFNNGNLVKDPSKKITVLTYSNQQDANVYKPPKGAVIEYTQEGEGEEKTLVLRFENFEKDDYGVVTKKLYSPQDYWQYKKLSFYLKSYPETLTNSPHFFIKFVTVDTNNYYLYLVENVPKEWTRYEIDIDKFTSLKLKRSSKDVNKLFNDPNIPGYYVKGHPNFKRIDRYIVGVKNEKNNKISGEVWFNELILTSPDRKGAYSVENSFMLNLGDIGNLNVNHSKNSAGFSGINLMRETFSKEDLGAALRLSLDKLLNINFLNLPLNYSIRTSKSLPLFKTGTDITLDRSTAEKEKSTSFSNGVSFSLSRRTQKKDLEKSLLDRFLNYTVDPLNYSFSYDYNKNLSPTNLSYNKNFQQSLTHRINFPFHGLKILGQRINPIPKNINTSISHSRVKNRGLSFDPRDSIWVQTNLYKREGGNLDYQVQEINLLNSLKLSFGGKIDYDVGLKKLTGKFYGKDIKRSSNYSLQYNPTLPSYINKFLSSANFSYNSTFSDDHDPINQKDSLNPLRRVDNRMSYTVNGNINTFELLYSFVKLGSREALRDINKLRSLLQNINVNYSRNLSSRYYDLRKSPSFYYELGRTMNPKIGYEENINNNINDSRNLNLNTGTRIQEISVSLSYSLRKNITYMTYQKTKTASNGRNFPNITVQIDMLNKKIKILDKFLSNLSLKTNYNYDLIKDEGQNITNERKIKNFTPLFSIQGRMRNGVGLVINYNKSEQNNISQSSGLITETKNITNNLNLTIDFSISKAISEKFLGFLKVRSEINTNISLTRQNSKTIINGIENQNSTTTNLNGTMNYRFTDDITGSFGIFYNLNRDNIQGISNKRYEINFGVRINF
ncbi:MAG: hypothetical protein ABDH37_05135 [Candidatus Hydrothermales bacterium]